MIIQSSHLLVYISCQVKGHFIFRLVTVGFLKFLWYILLHSHLLQNSYDMSIITLRILRTATARRAFIHKQGLVSGIITFLATWMASFRPSHKACLLPGCLHEPGSSRNPTVIAHVHAMTTQRTAQLYFMKLLISMFSQSLPGHKETRFMHTTVRWIWKKFGFLI